MAKKGDWIVCEDYQMTTFENGPNGPVFELVAHSGGKEYHLQIEAVNDRTELVQGLLRKMADLWPACDFQFHANARQEITDVRT